jgi:hypothetical protein
LPSYAKISLVQHKRDEHFSGAFLPVTWVAFTVENWPSHLHELLPLKKLLQLSDNKSPTIQINPTKGITLTRIAVSLQMVSE